MNRFNSIDSIDAEKLVRITSHLSGCTSGELAMLSQLIILEMCNRQTKKSLPIDYNDNSEQSELDDDSIVVCKAINKIEDPDIKGQSPDNPSYLFIPSQELEEEIDQENEKVKNHSDKNYEPYSIKEHICGDKKCECFYKFQDKPNFPDPARDNIELISNTSLFVANLPVNHSYDGVRKEFDRILRPISGRPARTMVPSARDSTKIVGVAYLTFNNHIDAVKAFHCLNTTKIFDAKIYVNFAFKR